MKERRLMFMLAHRLAEARKDTTAKKDRRAGRDGMLLGVRNPFCSSVPLSMTFQGVREWWPVAAQNLQPGELSLAKTVAGGSIVRNNRGP